MQPLGCSTDTGPAPEGSDPACVGTCKESPMQDVFSWRCAVANKSMEEDAPSQSSILRGLCQNMFRRVLQTVCAMDLREAEVH